MTSIASFNGGMGNDETLLAENQFVYSENIDIYRDPRCIQLAVKPVNYKTAMPSFVNIIGDTQVDITGANVGNKIFFALENKDIIDALGTLRFDGSTARPASTFYTWRGFARISSGISFWDYVGGLFIPQQVGAPAESPTWFRDDLAYNQDWTADKAYNMATTQLGSAGITRPFYTIGNELFFGDQQDHWNIDITSFSGGITGFPTGPFGPGYPTLAVYQQGISQPGEVVFASVHSDSVWSGSTSSLRNNSELSAVSVVAGVASNGVKQLQIDKYIKLLHGVNYNNTDIIVSGDVKEYTYAGGDHPVSVEYSAVYIYNHYGFGTDAQQLMARSRYYPNLAAAFSSPGVTHYLVGEFGQTDANWARINDMVYCISTYNEYAVIYGYGREIGGVTAGWSVVVSRNSSGKKMKRIGTLYRNPGKNGFYYSYEDEDGVFGVDYFDDITMATPTDFQPSGKIYLRNDDGGDMSIKKDISKISGGFYVPEDTTIKLSYILDNSGTEVDYETITHTTQGADSYKKWIGNKPIKGFKTIAWFAELATTGSDTPKIFNFNYEIAAIQN